MKRPSKKMLTEIQGELSKQYNAMVAERTVQALSKKGFDFQTEQDMHVFFKERIKGKIHNGITTLLVDGIEFCAYGNPEYDYEGGTKEKQDIKIKFKFHEL